MICSVDILPPRLSIMTNRGTIEFQSLNKSYGIRISFENILYIEKLCAMSLPNETGGILIGQYSSDCKWAEITNITKPPVGSIQRRGSFTRSGKTLLPLLDSFWKKDQYYIGEWHFHPYSSPFPSATDLQTMHSLSEEEYLHCPEPILIIVGGKPSAWAYHVSVFASGRQVILFQT